MSGLQFVVDFARSLAWPLAVVALVVVLRHPIVDILLQLAASLRRLRAGQSDAEFDRVVGQANAELTAAVSAGHTDPAAIPVLLRFAGQAQDDPPAAFAQALGAVEAVLRELLYASASCCPSAAVIRPRWRGSRGIRGSCPSRWSARLMASSACATSPPATRHGPPATTR
jgi:hypothetical protein